MYKDSRKWAYNSIFYIHSQTYNTSYYFLAPIEKRNPCEPSPCGPYSQCRETPDRQAICSCLPNYIGVAPNCRPECTTSNECSNNLACINNRCIPPCDQNPCARNAECRNINHNPICTCIDGFEGDPTNECTPIPFCKIFSCQI